MPGVSNTVGGQGMSPQIALCDDPNPHVLENAQQIVQGIFPKIVFFTKKYI